MKLFTLVTLIFLSVNVFADTKVLIHTTKGDIEVELNSAKAPETVKNFLKYVDDKFYDQTLMHRVVKGFVVQGGGLTKDMKEKPTRPAIQNEGKNGLSNLRGTIAMARETDPHSATAQFYFNLKDNTRLDSTPEKWGYAVFGKITKGLEVIDAMENVPVHTIGEYENVPVDPIITLSVRKM